MTEHIGRCDDCERFASERTALRKLVASGTRVSAPTNFDAMLKARLAEVKARRSFWWLGSPGYLRLGVATAGLIVMAFAAQYAGLLSHNGPPNGSQVGEVAPIPTPKPPEPIQPSPPGVVVSAGRQGSYSTQRTRRGDILTSRAAPAGRGTSRARSRTRTPVVRERRPASRAQRRYFLLNQRWQGTSFMNRGAAAIIVLMLASAARAQAPQPAKPVANQSSVPWAVSVVHTIDLDRMVELMREQQKLRVGVAGTAPPYIYNITTGIIIDDQGHVVTRLANLDPQDRDHKLTVTTGDGTILAAKLIGVDFATGFAVLHVASLKATTPKITRLSSLMNGALPDAVDSGVSRSRSGRQPVLESTRRAHVAI